MSNNKHNQILEWRELAWSDTLKPDVVAATLERLATAPELGTIVLEFRTNAKGARWLIASQPHRIPALKDALVSHLPVRLNKPRQNRPTMMAAGHVEVTGRAPLSSEANRVSATIRGLFGAVARLQDGEAITIQLILGRRLNAGYWNTSPVPSWWQLLAGSTPAQQKNLVRDKTTVHGFNAQLRIGAAGSPDRARFLIRQLFGGLRTIETTESRLRLVMEDPTKLNTVAMPWKWSLALRSNELPVFTGWPAGEPPLPLIGSIHPRVLPPSKKLEVDERVFGVTTAPGFEDRVSIPITDAAFHTHLLGPTGSGKSTVMLNLIQADMNAGRAVIVIDPKGDLATDVLARVPKHRVSDVVVIDPTNPSPVGFNPLAGPISTAAVRADTLLSIFESLFKENWGIRTADVLSAAFLTLARIKGANLLWLPALLTDPAFRHKVLKQAPDDQLGTDAFWRQYDAKKPDQQAVEIAPVLNKLRQLILRPGLRAILGQTDPLFHIEDLFMQKRIVVVNLNRGLLGSDAAKLLGTLLVGELWTALLGRQKLLAARRHIVPIYIDEVHDFISGLPADLSDALAQSRSLGGAFVLAHQYRAQLSPAMQQAVDANTRSKIIFGLNGADAAATAKHTPELDAQDFMLLPKYQAYANLMQAGDNTGWVSIATRPPGATVNDPANIYAASHESYGVSAQETEAQILELITAPAPPPVDGPIGRSRR